MKHSKDLEKKIGELVQKALNEGGNVEMPLPLAQELLHLNRDITEYLPSEEQSSLQITQIEFRYKDEYYQLFDRILIDASPITKGEVILRAPQQGWREYFEKEGKQRQLPSFPLLYTLIQRGINLEKDVIRPEKYLTHNTDLSRWFFCTATTIDYRNGRVIHNRGGPDEIAIPTAIPHISEEDFILSMKEGRRPQILHTSKDELTSFIQALLLTDQFLNIDLDALTGIIYFQDQTRRDYELLLDLKGSSLRPVFIANRANAPCFIGFTVIANYVEDYWGFTRGVRYQK